jgi:heterodisulfide reductase subunit B
MQQTRIERAFGENFNLAVLHYTQLLGLAIGINSEELALKEVRVDPTKIVEAIKV